MASWGRIPVLSAKRTFSPAAVRAHAAKYGLGDQSL